MVYLPGVGGGFYVPILPKPQNRASGFDRMRKSSALVCTSNVVWLVMAHVYGDDLNIIKNVIVFKLVLSLFGYT